MWFTVLGIVGCNDCDIEDFHKSPQMRIIQALKRQEAVNLVAKDAGSNDAFRAPVAFMI
jgi:PIN domain nuclease of toxin-antitoxin system